jgi:hypothetical protein
MQTRTRRILKQGRAGDDQTQRSDHPRRCFPQYRAKPRYRAMGVFTRSRRYPGATASRLARPTAHLRWDLILRVRARRLTG